MLWAPLNSVFLNMHYINDHLQLQVHNVIKIDTDRLFFVKFPLYQAVNV